MQTEHLLSIQNVYQRALALEKRIRLRALYPEGTVPYLKKLEYDGIVASPYGPAKTVAPRVTSFYTKAADRAPDPTQKYEYVPKSSMMHLGWMDSYGFNQSIPKFDPWFRHVLKSNAPEVAERLTSTYMRDPCTPDRVLEHFALFDREWKPVPTGNLMRRAKNLVSRMFAPLGQVEPIDFNYAGWHEILPHLDMTSSPGLPLRREYHTQGECLGHIYDKAKRLNHFAKFLPPHAVRAPPCMIGLRPGLLKIEELDSKIKARGVWAFPAEVKVMEMRFVIPLLKRMTEKFGKIPYPVGRNMTKALPFIIDHLLNDNRTGLVTDISKLDTSVGPGYIEWAFDLMKSWFVMGITQSSETRNDNVFEFLKYYFKRTPILLPSGQHLRKAGGVPSGSGFTQLVDTLVTCLITVYAMLRAGYDEEYIIGRLFVVGDDMATAVPSYFDLDEFIFYLDQLGFVVNKSKVMFSAKGIELKFLGYSKMGGGLYRPIEELLQTAMFPEKYVGNPERSRQRILGQVIASGLCNGFLAKSMQWLALLQGGLPMDPGETYIPQKRWMRNVLGLETTPINDNVFDLFPLT